MQAAIFDPATGAISIYNPIVVDKGDNPLVPPVVPVLPNGAIVATWFGYNANNLTLTIHFKETNAGEAVAVDGTIAVVVSPQSVTANLTVSVNGPSAIASDPS